MEIGLYEAHEHQTKRDLICMVFVFMDLDLLFPIAQILQKFWPSKSTFKEASI